MGAVERLRGEEGTVHGTHRRIGADKNPWEYHVTKYLASR